MNDLPMNGSAPATQNGVSAPATTGGFLGGMDMSTISALVVLLSAFMRR